MKAPEPKPASTTTVSKKQTPFFNKADSTLLSRKAVNDHVPFFANGSTSSSLNNKPTVQAKLTIGQPNDKYEQEADAMADKVVQRLAAPDVQTKKENSIQAKPVASEITPFIQTKCAACDHEEKLQKKEEDETDQLDGELQRKPIFESAEPPEDENTIQRKCAECEKEDEKKVQTKAENSSPSHASSSVESTLSSSKGSGNPLSSDTRTQMEYSFGADFSSVRIHNDSSAVQMSKDLSAQAFTHGSDIYFNSGKYDTNSSEGKHLLAHELTHTLQQSNNAIQRQEEVQYADKLTELRDAISEGNPVAGIGNFAKAYDILNSLGTYAMLKVLEELHKTPDFEVLIWYLPHPEYGLLRTRAAINTIKFFEKKVSAPITDIVREIPELTDLPEDDFTEVEKYLGATIINEDNVLERAKIFKPTGLNQQDLLQQLNIIQRNFTSIENDTTNFFRITRLDYIKKSVEKRIEKFQVKQNPVEVRRWSAMIAAQLDIVVRSASGTNFVVSRLENMKKSMSEDETIPPEVVEPLFRMGAAYAAAAEASEWVDIGYRKLEIADEFAKTIEIDILEGTIRASERLVSESKELSKGKINADDFLKKEYRDELTHARSYVDKDPDRSADIVEGVKPKIGSLYEKAMVAHMTAQLVALSNAIDDVNNELEPVADFADKKELIEMKGKLYPYLEQWILLLAAYRKEDEAEKSKIRTTLQNGSEEFGKLITSINSKLRSLVKMLERRQIIKMIILAVIAVATLFFGGFLIGLAAGLELGTVGTFLLITGGEALFFTVATSALIENDPTLGKFIKSFFTNWALFGGLRMVSGIYRTIFPAFSKTGIGAVGELVTVLTAGTLASLKLADYEKRKRTGEGLTASEVRHAVFEGIVIAVVTVVAGRVGDKFLKGFKAKGFKLGSKIAEINKARANLKLAADAITGANTSNVKQIGQPDQTTSKTESEQKPVRNIDEAQDILDRDAALLKEENAALELAAAETSKNPASPEAQQVKAELEANNQNIQNNETAKIATYLEPAGPNEVLCEAGKLDLVEAHQQKDPNVTVTRNQGPNGERSLTITPKDSTTGSPFTITEKVTPGSGDSLTRPPERVDATEPVPVESKFKAFSDLLSDDGVTFRDKTLEEGYDSYSKKQTQRKKPVKSRGDWARSQTTGRFRKILEGELGSDFFKGGGTKINIRNIARSREYPPDRYLADESTVRPYERDVLKAAGIDPAEGIPGGEMSRGAFNGAKGVVAEILARTKIVDILAAIRKLYPDAVLLNKVRLKVGGKGQAKLFTDGLIGYFKGKDLFIVGRVEVKSGSTGGQEATVQFFEWVEGRISPGSELVIPGRGSFAYGPTKAQRASGMGVVNGLTNAESHIITAKGADHLGKGSEMQTTTEHQRTALDHTAEDIEFLTRLILDPYVTPKKSGQ